MTNDTNTPLLDLARERRAEALYKRDRKAWPADDPGVDWAELCDRAKNIWRRAVKQ